MRENTAAFTGNIPKNYDTGMGPVLFAGYADDMARRAPVLDQIIQRGGADTVQVQDAVAAGLRREYGIEPTVMPMQAIIFEARKG